MNCQDITRIVDARSLDTLTDIERRDAETHARACPHCAPLWFAHSRLAAARIPAMPPELSVRCLTLAARAHTSAPRHASRRIMVVVGSVIVLAAAAAMLTTKLINPPASQSQDSANAAPQSSTPPATPQPQDTQVTASQAVPEPQTPAEEQAAPRAQPSSAKLPLLPAPFGAMNDNSARYSLALRKAAELYPDLVQGPETNDYFVVALALHPDGTVLSKAMQMATQETVQEVQNRFTKSLIDDMGAGTSAGMAKGGQLPDGRILRANLALLFSVASSDFNPAQSERRVKEVVRANRAHLMLPPSRDGMNVLTVYLADDGTILRENVELRAMAELMKQDSKKDDPASFAKEIAARLGYSADQLGVVGFTFLADVPQPGSTERPRALGIEYAWPRRPTASEPAIIRNASPRNLGINMAAALAIVERLLPEVFTQKDRSQGRPTVVLTAEGEVIRVEYVKIEEMPQQMQKLAPGRVTYSGTSADLVNKAGAKADVQFIWQFTAAQKEAMDKARLAAPAP
jgi:hypothetical protein